MRKEGDARHPQWYAHVFHEVPADRVPLLAATGTLGLDRNVGQATDSDGCIYTVPDAAKLEANSKRKQRKADKARERSRRNGQPLSHRGRRICGQLSKPRRKQKRKRQSAACQPNRTLADTAHTVVVEDLDTKAMTGVQWVRWRPRAGTSGRRPALNRGMLKSNWGLLERQLAYKAGALAKVDPAYMSQTCAVCQHADRANRKTQALFHCTACGPTANGDHNAARNILARGSPLVRPAREVEASARRGAFPSGTPTTREPGRQGPMGRPPYRVSTPRYKPHCKQWDKTAPKAALPV